LKKKVLAVPLSLLFMISVLTGCVEEYKTSTVEATVLEKDYDAPKTTYKTVTQDGKKVKKKKTEPAEYEVTLQYKDIVTEFEDKELYDKVKEGQEIKVLYKEGYDKNGKLVAEHIELID
jgi:hypothetical protein